VVENRLIKGKGHKSQSVKQKPIVKQKGHKNKKKQSKQATSKIKLKAVRLK